MGMGGSTTHQLIWSCGVAPAWGGDIQRNQRNGIESSNAHCVFMDSWRIAEIPLEITGGKYI